MVSINYSAREVCCKIVYYGPGLSGKTTNLQYVHAKIPTNTKGKLISLATEADRTLYFDFLPINIGTINGFQAKFQLYTVPGQVYYNATRKLVLRGVDGLVFVADSQPDKMDENIESLANLEENLVEYGYDINTLPMVIQYNKRDLPGVMSVEELNAKLNTRNWPYYEASATIGNGVFDTLKRIIKLVLERAKTSSSAKIASASTTEEAEQSEQPAMAGVGGTGNAGMHAGPVGDRQPAPRSTPEPEPSSGYRPYPGSETGGVKRPSKESSSATPETGDQSGTQADDTATNKPQSQPASDGRPQMAPSLRRRPETKKRGFFKRLFGIK